MADEIQSGSGPEATEVTAESAPTAEAPKQDTPKPDATKQGAAKPEGQKGRGEGQQQRQGGKPQQQGQRREGRPQGGENRGERPAGDRGPRGERGRDDRRGGERGGERGGDRREGRPGGGRPFELAPDIELDRLISDSLYLDNQAHTVVARMRDMDSGTKSQLRRLYNAVRRAVRAPESEKQHQFVMLRARLAYTIARHSLRSLDALERLLLQVTRKNDARGYERFKDLFEAIVAYNE
ncbi:MAG: type III-A CRISPR-associated protein Csm2 [Bryobacteraceae bacterium]